MPRLQLITGLLALGVVCLSLSGLAHQGGAAESAPPLLQAHAHNDYEHARPLRDALDNGFCSVEADIYLIKGRLLVAHDRDEVRPDRTLQRLYLDPLRDQVRLHGDRVYPHGPEFILLIDFKSEAVSTYQALAAVLESYQDMLTRYENQRVHKKAVTIILSGNRPTSLLAREERRLAFIDGRLKDLKANPPVTLMPLVSDNWRRHFQWKGQGPVSSKDREKLRTIVQQAHDQNRLLRFWATPDQPEAWNLLQQADVDLINTDNLPGLRRFLSSH